MEIQKIFLEKSKERPFWDTVREFKKENSIKYCIEHKDILVKSLLKYKRTEEANSYNAFKEREDERLKSIKLGNELIYQVKCGIHHYCTCGGSLRWVTNWEFVGCDNYLDTSKEHIKLRFREFKASEYFHSFSKNYLSDFKKKYGFPDYLMVSILFSFLHRVWNIEPLAEIDEDYFITGKKNADRSKTEEAVIEKYLNLIYDKVMYQPNFTVVYPDGRKDLKIPDFICGNLTNVLLVEVKKAEHLIDKMKLSYYHHIVSKFMDLSNDRRKLDSCTIIYEYCKQDSKEVFHISNITKHLPII